MTDHDAEFDAIVEELQRAGFVTIGADAEGEETWTLPRPASRSRCSCPCRARTMLRRCWRRC